MALRSTREKNTVTAVANAAPVIRPPRRPRQVASLTPRKPKFGTVQVTLGETTTDYTVPSSTQP